MTVIFCHAVIAQTAEKCGTVPYMQQLISKHPALKGRLEDNEKGLQKKIAEKIPSQSSVNRIVPVVVHLIWNTPQQNLCDAQIRSQIDVLNEDYHRLNADTVNTPGPFKQLGGDANIHFVLANRDPQGNKTTGIIRSYTDYEDFPVGGDVKFTATGGQDEWNPNWYLNIWVCNLEGSILGFATLPGTANPGEDGVVIATKAFGWQSYDPSGKYNLGRTTTHEVGHWLNLLHIWGDDGGNCSQDDEVADTPEQGDYTFDCPDFPVKSCSNGPNGNMFMNYMDYTDDRCMNIFTKGQIDRMQAALDTLRPGILTSPGYVNDGDSADGLNNKLKAGIIIAPNPFVDEFDIHVRLKNISNLEVEVFDVSGKLVLNKQFNDCQCEIFHIDAKKLTPGIYIARVKSAEETVVTKLYRYR